MASANAHSPFDLAIDGTVERLDLRSGPLGVSRLEAQSLRQKAERSRESAPGEKWRLLLGLERLRLLDECGDEVIVVPSHSAEQIVLLPGSPTETGSAAANLGIRFSGETYWFRPDRQMVSSIKTYFDLVILMQGEGAYANAMANERFNFVCGLLALPGSLALTLGILVASIWLGGKIGFLQPIIAGGVLLAGLTCFANGVLSLARTRRLRRLHDQLDGMKLKSPIE